MIRGMHHISLSITDLDRFVHFYRDLLGVELDRISPLEPGFEAFETFVGLHNVSGRVAQFNLGNMNMEVFCYDRPTPRPGERRSAGVDFISPPQRIEPGKCASCYFYDPDGNILELQELFAGTPIRAAFGID